MNYAKGASSIRVRHTGPAPGNARLALEGPITFQAVCRAYALGAPGRKA